MSPINFEVFLKLPDFLKPKMVSGFATREATQIQSFLLSVKFRFTYGESGMWLNVGKFQNVLTMTVSIIVLISKCMSPDLLHVV